tara:strand:+ start:2165 stop:2494 length:330 start_codon:yes stop_codon:yes gene_type:complete
MGWEKIIKGNGRGVSLNDIKALNYILRDGEFRTFDVIMDEIYDLIEENKGNHGRRQNPIQITRFSAAKATLKMFMTKSPDYEVRDTGNKTPIDSYYYPMPIKEYRYIGE